MKYAILASTMMSVALVGTAFAHSGSHEKVKCAFNCSEQTANHTHENEHSIKPFTPSKGKLTNNNSTVKNCKGGTKKSYNINFMGTPPAKVCQVSNPTKWLETGEIPKNPTDDYWGFPYNKCLETVVPPTDLFVFGPSEDAFCPYDNPQVAEFVVTKENAFVDALVEIYGGSGGSSGDWFKTSVEYLQPFYFKTISGNIPMEMWDTDFGKQDWASYRRVQGNHENLITAYLDGDEAASLKMLDFLVEYDENDAFSVYSYVPGTVAGNDRDGRFYDLTEPDFYDFAMNRLNMILPAMINMYGIVKKEHSDHEKFAQVESYVESLVWMIQDTGVLHGRFGRQKGKLKWSIEQLDHHSTWHAMLYTLWGVTKGDDLYFNAGMNTFVATLQNSRQDGSIISEVKRAPRKKSSHGGYGSLIRHTESTSFAALAAAIISTQGYDVTKINVNGVTVVDLINFSVESAVNPSIANKVTKETEYDMRHLTYPSDFKRGYNWYPFVKEFYEIPVNEQFESEISDHKQNFRLRVFGIEKLNRL